MLVKVFVLSLCAAAVSAAENNTVAPATTAPAKTDAKTTVSGLSATSAPALAEVNLLEVIQSLELPLFHMSEDDNDKCATQVIKAIHTQAVKINEDTVIKEWSGDQFKEFLKGLTECENYNKNLLAKQTNEVHQVLLFIEDLLNQKLTVDEITQKLAQLLVTAHVQDESTFFCGGYVENEIGALNATGDAKEPTSKTTAENVLAFFKNATVTVGQEAKNCQETMTCHYKSCVPSYEVEDEKFVRVDQFANADEVDNALAAQVTDKVMYGGIKLEAHSVNIATSNLCNKFCNMQDSAYRYSYHSVIKPSESGQPSWGSKDYSNGVMHDLLHSDLARIAQVMHDRVQAIQVKQTTAPSSSSSEEVKCDFGALDGEAMGAMVITLLSLSSVQFLYMIYHMLRKMLSPSSGGFSSLNSGILD